MRNKQKYWIRLIVRGHWIVKEDIEGTKEEKRWKERSWTGVLNALMVDLYSYNER